MKITVEVNENEILDAADEMIEAADDLGKKAWRLKSLIQSKGMSLPEEKKKKKITY